MTNEISGLKLSHPPAATPARSTSAASQTGSTPASKPQAQRAETVVISSNAKLLQSPVAARHEDAGIDMRRLDHVKQELAAGRYPVDAKRLAAQVAVLRNGAGGYGGPLERAVDLVRNEHGHELTVTTTGPGGRSRTLASAVTYDQESQSASREVTRTGHRGHESHRHGEIKRTEGGFTTELELTTPDGRSLSRHVSQTYEPETDVLTRQVTVSTFDGRQITRSIEIERPGGDAPYADPPVMPPTSELQDD